MVTRKPTGGAERDSERTRAKILDAVGKLLARAGFVGLGVNAVAREAGVDKVLIYRYFGGLRELLRAYAREGRFWPTIRELFGGGVDALRGEDLTSLSKRVLLRHLQALRERPETQEILRWELLERNELTDELARTREAQGLEILGLLPGPESERRDVDLPAIAAVLHAGLTYLVLRSKTADAYLGLELHRDEDWRRIERAVETLVEAAMPTRRRGSG